MTTLLEQRAAELVAASAQKALLAFETEYQELLAPIAGSRLSYKVVPTEDGRLTLRFEQVPTGEWADFLLHDSGRVSTPHLPELTPQQLTQVLAEYIVSWQQEGELRQWEARVKPFRLFGRLWPVLGMVGASLSLSLLLHYDRDYQLMSTSRLLWLLCAYLAPALAAFVTDWCYGINHRLLTAAITFQTPTKHSLAAPCSA